MLVVSSSQSSSVVVGLAVAEVLEEVFNAGVSSSQSSSAVVGLAITEDLVLDAIGLTLLVAERVTDVSSSQSSSVAVGLEAEDVLAVVLEEDLAIEVSSSQSSSVEVGLTVAEDLAEVATGLTLLVALFGNDSSSSLQSGRTLCLVSGTAIRAVIFTFGGNINLAFEISF